MPNVIEGDQLQINRGPESLIPTLPRGGLFFALDTGNLFAGDGSKNYLINGLTVVDLTSNVTGILPEANGGTGVSDHGSLNAAVFGSGGATAGYALTADGGGGTVWFPVPSEHDAVTLTGSYDYLTISGQEITLNQIDLTTDVTGILAVANGGTGVNDLGDLNLTSFSSGGATDGHVATADGAGGVVWEAVPGAHDAVTLSGSYDYLTIADQKITLNQIDLTTDVTGILPDDHLPTTAELIAATSASWDWYTVSDSEYSILTLARARAATSDMANDDLIGLLDFVGRANSSNQSMASVFSRYTGNGTTTDASVEVWIDSGSGLSEVFKIADDTIYLSAQSNGPSVLVLNNGSKAVATVSPSTAGKVLTSNGTGANPSFEDPVTATNGSDEANATTDLDSSVGTWMDTGAEFTPGSNGTYLLQASLYFRLQLSAGTGAVQVRIQNVTDATTLTNTETLVELSNNTNLSQRTVGLNFPPASLTSGKTYRLQAKATDVSSATFTNADIFSNSDGRTILNRIKLSN